MKKITQSVKTTKPVSLLPNVLLLPAPHHRKWGWLIWTIILLGLLLGSIWLLRGCKTTVVSAVQAEALQAHYGKFDLLDGGPSLTGGPYNLLAQGLHYYHEVMPDGRILFVSDLTNRLDTSQTDSAADPAEIAQQVFIFDPAVNKFQDSPVSLNDKYDLDTNLLIKSGQLAVFDLDPTELRNASGNLFNTGPGGVNPKLALYDSLTGEKTDIKPEGEDLASTHFGQHPYIFELSDGILIGAVEYSQIGNYAAKQTTAVTFFYDYHTQKLTKQVGSIGLPDTDYYTSQPVVKLTDDQSLILSGADLYLLDHKTKTAVFKRRLTAYQSNEIISAQIIPNTTLVWIIASNSQTITADSIIYLYNFETNNLYSHRLGNLPLKQGTVASEYIPGQSSGIPRESDEPADSNQPATINEAETNLYHLQPLRDGTVLITGSRYYDLPWSFGLTTLLKNQWLDRADQATTADIDPANNYAAQLAANLADSSSAYNCTIQDSILLSDGRVLFAGCRWFTYTPAASKTSTQTNNANTFASQLGQVGHWTDGGKLLVGDAEKTTNDEEYSLVTDANPKFGIPYALPNGKVLFVNPVLEKQQNEWVNTDVFGQVYDPATSRSQWVTSSNIIGKKVPYTNGVTDSKGNVHFFDTLKDEELIYYANSDQLVLRSLVGQDYGDGVYKPDSATAFAGLPVAVDDKIFFFDGQTVVVFNIKNGQYSDIEKQREAAWLEKHPKDNVSQEVMDELNSGLPIFDATCTVSDPTARSKNLFGGVSSGSKEVLCGVESALYLGNHRILLAGGNQLKIYNYQSTKTEALPDLENILNIRQLFRMSDGRVALVGQATLPNGETLRSGQPDTVKTQVIEILNINTQTVSDPITNPHFPMGGTMDISYDVWSLPNDRLLFAAQLGTRLSLYDLQRHCWLNPPEALVNLGYANNDLITQLSDRPTIIKIATKLSYVDYTKETLATDTTSQSDVTVLPADAVELFIPETGPWGYYDSTVFRMSWWLWFLTLQLVQAFAGGAVIIAKKLRRRFIIPL
ncbi:MAG: hypothetical protein WC553_03545 [Patescibacteria group bacterium]